MHIHSKSCCGKMSWACNDKIGCYAAAAEKRRGVQLDWVELLPQKPFTARRGSNGFAGDGAAAAADVLRFCRPVYYASLVPVK